MIRPLRLEFAGALYHLTFRGDRQEPIIETSERSYSCYDLAYRNCPPTGQICVEIESASLRGTLGKVVPSYKVESSGANPQ